MSKKVSIIVEVPGINSTTHFLVPEDMTVLRVASLIGKTLTEEYSGIPQGNDSERKLLLRSEGKILRLNCSLKQLGIRDGAEIILI